MSKFEKIDLDTFLKTDTTSSSGFQSRRLMRRRRSQRFRLSADLFKSKKAGIIGGVLLILILIVVFGVIMPAKTFYAATKKTEAQAKLVGSAMKAENISLASDYLGTTRTDLMET